MIRNIKKNFVWIIVIASIILNIIATRYELSGRNLIDHPYLGFLLYPFSDIRYGYFVARKLFITIIAFGVFGYWVIKQKGIVDQIKNSKNYIILIGLALFLSRILTYGFWYYNDDTRFFHYHLFAPAQPGYDSQGVWGPFGFHPIAIFL